jgi:hypothetical protein
LPNDEVAGVVAVTGWALKESVGIGRVELMLDGAPVAQVDYGVPRADVLEYWKVHEGSDRVGFRTSLDLSGHPGGEAWLGLRIHGLDGSIEDWPQQRIRVRPQGSR